MRLKPVKIHRIGALSEFNAAQSPDYFYRQDVHLPEWELAILTWHLSIPRAATIDFWLSAERDAAAAKRFLQKALQTRSHR